MNKNQKCSSGKRVYLSENIAVDALIEAHTRFDYTAGNGPVTVYKCDDCGHYHLTSQGQMHQRLAAVKKDGSLRLQKEAGKWLDKFKGR